MLDKINMKQKTIDETIGWVGMSLVVTAYALISFNVLSSASLLYQTMNVIGSIGIIYISFKKKTYQPGILNIIWIIIALISIIRILI